MTRETRRRGPTVCFHPNEVLEKAKNPVTDSRSVIDRGGGSGRRLKKGHKDTEGNGTVLALWCGCYTGVYICQNSSNVCLKWVHFLVNCTSIKLI